MVQAASVTAAAPIGHRRPEKVWHATYVLYERIRDYLACGWMVVIPNAPMDHMHAYGIVMEWRCDCKIARPPR